MVGERSEVFFLPPTISLVVNHPLLFLCTCLDSGTSDKITSSHYQLSVDSYNAKYFLEQEKENENKKIDVCVCSLISEWVLKTHL